MAGDRNRFPRRCLGASPRVRSTLGILRFFHSIRLRTGRGRRRHPTGLPTHGDKSPSMHRNDAGSMLRLGKRHETDRMCGRNTSRRTIRRSEVKVCIHNSPPYTIPVSAFDPGRFGVRSNRKRNNVVKRDDESSHECLDQNRLVSQLSVNRSSHRKLEPDTEVGGTIRQRGLSGSGTGSLLAGWKRAVVVS